MGRQDLCLEDNNNNKKSQRKLRKIMDANIEMFKQRMNQNYLERE